MLASGIGFTNINVAGLAPHQQLLAWRDWLSGIIDVVVSRDQVTDPFRCISDQYSVGEFNFSDTFADFAVVDRSITRISRDSLRKIVFTTYLDGEAHASVTHARDRPSTLTAGSVFAVDLDQPVRLARQACRHVTFSLPPSLLQDVFPDPGAVHGRVLDPRKPGTRLIVNRVTALVETIRHMSFEEAHRNLSDLAHLIVAAFGEQAGLRGSQRAVRRALMLDDARRFIRANLYDWELSPERVVEALGLPRPTIYRLFQHEGGLGTYIRHLRLRAAVDDLVQFPGLPIKEIAYSVGFKSASDFTRAFRRAYDIAPQEVRVTEDLDLDARLRRTA
jgi:AraC-like DNA-binding protein